MGKLTALAISKAGPGKYFDGDGLELRKKDKASGKWVWRYSFAARRREMGLGPYPLISLSDARQERDRWRRKLLKGIDPITERNERKLAALAEMDREDPSLEEIAEKVLDLMKAKLRDGGKRGRWMSPLSIHVFPKLGRRHISTIKARDIATTLKPIWRRKHPTAQKAMQRLHIIFRQAQVMGFDTDPIEVDRAKQLLGDVVHRSKHITATPWQDIPKLYAKLDGKGPVAECLRFMILTMVRSAACRPARFDEILDNVWTVPEQRIKGRVGQVDEFRVPLSTEAMLIIERQRQFGGPFLFTAHRGNPITDNSLSHHLTAIGEPGRPHGFRTSFRSWVQDTDATTFDVSETILGHKVGSKVERSYARSDLLERRALVMQAWADFVSQQ